MSVTESVSALNARYELEETVFSRSVLMHFQSCLRADCEQCSSGEENHCQNDYMLTYGQKYKDSGETAQGGYAKYWRGNAHFVFKIPDAISSEIAAPMLCAGVTTYSPLKQNGCGPGESSKRLCVATF